MRKGGRARTHHLKTHISHGRTRYFEPMQARRCAAAAALRSQKEDQDEEQRRDQFHEES